MIDELRRLVGEANVVTGPDAAPFLVDVRDTHRGVALAIVRPADTSEVAAVVRWAAEHDVAVTTQGGNTGLSGGAAPAGRRPSIVLSTRRLDGVEVDAARWTMTVGAGATIEAMQDAAAAHARLFAPDWGARGTATIGGAIATDAGGNNVVRYGNMRDQVLGVEVVLADGRIWDGLRALRKDSSGYDLKQLVIGSEGTLGVVTRAVVRLHPPTPHRQSAMAALDELNAVGAFFDIARRVAGDAVVAFELMPDTGIRAASDRFGLPRPLATTAEYAVLLRLAASEPVGDRLAAVLAQAADARVIDDAVVAVTAEHERQLWTIRDELSPNVLFPDRYPDAIKLDTAVPIDRIAEFIRAAERLAAEIAPDSDVYAFGHVGDGNVHLYVLPPTAPADRGRFRDLTPRLVAELDALTFELGGTLSAEHGVGRALVDRIGAQKPAVEWELMRTIKTAFDPDGRFNPGAVLPDDD